MAEPDLIALSGDTASFIAGGEYPVPVCQAAATVGGACAVTIQYQPFGVQLSFNPTVLDNGIINVRLAPSVSELNFAQAVTINGFNIPSINKREARTTVELRDGQSFVIAGLLDNISQDDRAAIPILSQIPIIGALFKSSAERSEQTELMVLITPRLVRPLDPDEVPALPTEPGVFLQTPSRSGGEGAEGPVVRPDSNNGRR